MDMHAARQLLRVEWNASRCQIAQAFRMLSVSCHPDKNPDDQSAAQRFHQLTAARDCLLVWAPQYPCVDVREGESAAPVGGGHSPTKRKRTGTQQKKAAQKLLTAEGGFTDKGRMAYRAEGGVLATGNERTCLPDALFVLLPALGHPVELDDVRSIMPPDGNTLFTVCLPHPARLVSPC